MVPPVPEILHVRSLPVVKIKIYLLYKTKSLSEFKILLCILLKHSEAHLHGQQN